MQDIQVGGVTIPGVIILYALKMVYEKIKDFLSRWGQQKMPETVRAEMSQTDQEKIEATRQLISECFEGDPVACMRDASNVEKINLMSEFAHKLAEEYGLDAEIDVTISGDNNWGSYDWKENKAVFNIAPIVMAAQDEKFAYYVKESLDTIVHELRHAVQCRAIREPGFWNIDDERRKGWADNIQNYISDATDYKAYTRQPIESDAFTFAALALEGVGA